MFLKVYKRGAVGRSIDMTRYAGYDELKQDLARRFGIEGQLEGRQRVGWKLVYVDHENDVLLVGDDPWEYVSLHNRFIFCHLSTFLINRIIIFHTLIAGNSSTVFVA